MPSRDIEAISYKEALERIRKLRTFLVAELNKLDRDSLSKGNFFWLSTYILALSAQEMMISSVNDGLIASDIPWDSQVNIPSTSATVGDATSYAERLSDPKDHFLKALLLSFSGWTLLSTEKKECACGKGKLQDISVDVLVNTALRVEPNSNQLSLAFFVGVQSDDQEHLKCHYSYKETRSRDEGLIIIHRSRGHIRPKNSYAAYYYVEENLNQAEQFRSNKLAEILSGLILSFHPTLPLQPLPPL